MSRLANCNVTSKVVRALRKAGFVERQGGETHDHGQDAHATKCGRHRCGIEGFHPALRPVSPLADFRLNYMTARDCAPVFQSRAVPSPFFILTEPLNPGIPG